MPRSRWWLVAGAAGAAAIAVGAVVALALVPIQHHGCEVAGSSVNYSETHITASTNCGWFLLPLETSGRSDVTDLLLFPETALDITTQGFSVWPPALRITSVQASVDD